LHRTLIVFDAPVLVSAAIGVGGIPLQAFAKARAAGSLAMSRQVFDEISDVLHRSALARFLDPALRDDLLDQLVFGTEWFAPGIVVTDCRDVADNKYLELALASGATVIVSGDQELLVLDPWRGIRILRPADYLNHA
jgi:putative PIN family toxin of toxin-antitoxin system